MSDYSEHDHGYTSPPPPPPPPPPHQAPPGYAAYDNPPSSGQLARVGGIGKTLVVLVGIAGAASLLTALLSGTARDSASDYLAGEITEDEFLESYVAVGLLGIVQLAATIAAFVLTIIFMYRLATNHRRLGRVGTWGPGWAIGGWFLPPLVVYAIPFLMLRELWKASDPDASSGAAGEDETWKRSDVSPAITVWWVLYGLVPLALLIGQGASSFGGGGGGFTTTTEAIAESIEEDFTWTVVGGAASALAAVAFIVVVRGLAARHRRLTGES